MVWRGIVITIIIWGRCKANGSRFCLLEKERRSISIAVFGVGQL